MMNYNEIVLKHFFNPQHVGVFAADASVFIGRAGKHGAADQLQIQLVIGDDTIIAARFKAYGNPYTIAAGSVLMEKINGLPLKEASKLKYKYFADILEIPQTSLYSALLAEDALTFALEAYNKECVI